MANLTKDKFIEAVNNNVFKYLIIFKVRPLPGVSNYENSIHAQTKIKDFLKRSGSGASFVGFAKNEIHMESYWCLVSGKNLTFERLCSLKTSWPDGGMSVMSVQTPTSKSMINTAMKTIDMDDPDSFNIVQEGVSFASTYHDGIEQPASLKIIN